ncbi:hypothetical protein [Candidatus Methylacidithermus pantelleriae]|uniref:Uncharacterized protein n=1 Tax=Candidatus Methylacidithermus pantelleriae TaxID=2744239 RepID=A0A8J2FR83_9BACT|nr:hypothetical protein [Candidatus Methylacidithermus pantelleriae]CAF0689081.1 hypothetical protein MPNT_10104 [Candidatus Methylacidithermus pantelleriae]
MGLRLTETGFSGFLPCHGILHRTYLDFYHYWFVGAHAGEVRLGELARGS